MRLLFVIGIFIMSFSVKSQSVNGVVTDANGKPLNDVMIYNFISKVHGHSDISGKFVLENTKPEDSLRVTKQGYVTKNTTISNAEMLSIILDEKLFLLEEVTITNSLKYLNTISKIDFEIQPISNSQDLMRKVPGLFIGQHAGGGKAEQIFLRGFDCDHGTDINVTVDGMPVNMVSHAHGQGYADLHFVIPETVDKIDFDKGSYFADKGDFTTAGYVGFNTKEVLTNNAVSFEAGQFDTFRTVALFNLLHTENQSAYFAGEYMMTDGYFDAPQNFNRINLFAKYTAKVNNGDKLAVSLSHFTSQWDASGQIPDRAVNDGTISHFGAIDPNEGGNTGRTNFNLQYDSKIDDHSHIKNNAFLSKYDFELYSNFTFFLNDPVNGDQIKQKENRTIVGFQSEYNNKLSDKWLFKLGAGLRNDNNKDVELSHTVNRKTVLDYLSLGNVNQTNLFTYISFDFTSGKWLINSGLRLDYFKFGYEDQLAPTYTNQTQTKAIVSPKLNFLYTENNTLQYFLKLGKGFHSNDTRVVVAQKGQEILPETYGGDLGINWKPFPRMIVNSAIWYLYLAQEFVYVGDEAVVEPSGQTERKGFDFGFRYQLTNWLFWNTDYTYTHARSMDEPKGNDYLPLAPVHTLMNGISVKDLYGFSGSLRTRFLGDRPANEDNSVVAKGYCITDFSVNYQIKKISIGLNIDNIFDTKWKETQFLTETRLANETEPVEEIHFTAGTPFNARLILKYSW
ncbi:TonB-dependent receptor [Flavobacterium saccharophilum]|uniref:Outer membrane receptor proteins, mostly Fe transport n=1 Tax=Flavobacterium saccharophilum TaxID=29534 RepID=A0A1M7I9I5_9FLAO|nr:TonB-dependent receptor plug domain-containing protein [Flavobacterium saccharophilum]SHM37309.1 Outer membrane receptor proteins, mostly Fe transport [Flavobacterium saccharophilum]